LVTKKKKKKKRFTLEPKTSPRNYNIVKSIVHWTKRGKKKGPVGGVSIWVVRKVLKWRWLALLPVRLLFVCWWTHQCQATAGVLLLLPSGGPGSKQVEGCWRWVPAFGSM
jgi:zona occludens toxin (predicted ATPase)